MNRGDGEAYKMVWSRAASTLASMPSCSGAEAAGDDDGGLLGGSEGDAGPLGGSEGDGSERPRSECDGEGKLGLGESSRR